MVSWYALFLFLCTLCGRRGFVCPDSRQFSGVENTPPASYPAAGNAYPHVSTVLYTRRGRGNGVQSSRRLSSPAVARTIVGLGGPSSPRCPFFSPSPLAIFTPHQNPRLYYGTLYRVVKRRQSLSCVTKRCHAG
ncbi:hypothetical protein F5144DRAFT_580251 [Chaetomium tenue]|uniref:Uncharacterized protein n=1 Tax=Chaetomium tenue TaxID=1854479 RepID=A0ACB7P501_9PEZI|nr:hypothetical protein F5144DRAFT_580251 [Chaetomium globosum]